MNKLMMLQAKGYEFISNNLTHKISTCFIAQDVLSHFPDLESVFDHQPKNFMDKNSYFEINCAGFSVIAIKAIREQQTIIESQNKKKRS